MTRYLLSNGVMTTNLVDYAIDYIKVYLMTRYNDVPYLQFGNMMDMSVNTRDEVLYQIRVAINKVISNLNTQYGELNMKLDFIGFDRLNNLIANIRIKNQNFNMVFNNL